MFQSSEKMVSQYLDPSERLLWSGQPRGGFRFRAQDAFLIPFSLVWCSFAIFWEVSAIRSGAPFFSMVWGIPFVCLGLFFVFGRFFLDAHIRAGTTYAVTTERILILSGLFSRQTKSIQIRMLADVSLTQYKDGSGTITFGPVGCMKSSFQATPWPGIGSHAIPPIFDLIDRAEGVYDIIRNAQRATNSNS